jgi:stage II sporulation protein D
LPSDFRNLRGMFKNDKWLWIPGILLAIVLAVVIRGQRMAPKPNQFTEEPTLSVYFHESGEVKSLPLETYLQGVVAAEMEPSWPLAALEAQAIVARTFTVKKLEEGKLPNRDAQASTDPKEFQAYNAAKVNDRVKEAVQNTRGQVLTHRGETIMAWFHAASGGKTATPSEGLNYKGEATPYVTPVTDVQPEPVQAWSRTFSNAQVSEACETQGISVGTITSIKIGRRGPSGRAETLIVNGKEVSAPALRLAIGGTAMRSTLLDEVRMQGDSIVMRGRGYGHGVGMSQWGAWLMAQRGKSAKDIVTYYYKGVDVQTFWE